MLLTCALNCAMYLELTPDMLILSFIEAVKRFVSRRCMPDQLISGDFKICSLVKVKICYVHCGVKQWFILSASSWWGGFYGRVVHSVK